MDYNLEIKRFKKKRIANAVIAVFFIFVALVFTDASAWTRLPLYFIICIYTLGFLTAWDKIKHLKREKIIVEDYIKNKAKYKSDADFLNHHFQEIFESFYRQFGGGHQSPITFINHDNVTRAYRLLKLNPSDSTEAIKKRYKELAIKYHPDKWATHTQKAKDTAERNFKKLNSAYELIKKDKKIT